MSATRMIHHITHADGDLKYALICLKNGIRDKNANSTNKPEIVASALLSTHTGNCDIVAASGAPTSRTSAEILHIFPFVVLCIALLLRVAALLCRRLRLGGLDNLFELVLVPDKFQNVRVFQINKVFYALRNIF